MPETEEAKCVACQQPCGDGRFNFTLQSGAERHVPSCQECGEGGRAEAWVKRACDAWSESGLAFESSGDFMKDYNTFRGAAKHNSRIEDGICPNGCAQMVPINGSRFQGECPSCHFQLFKNTPINFM